MTELEIRIIASLIEKETTVPDTYPLSLNSIKNACNQKSNREPVMNLEEGKILHTLNNLIDKEYVMADTGGRTLKYAHRFHRILEIDRAQLAIIATLLLRGPQTLNEIWTRSKRLFAFDMQEQVQKELLALIDKEMAVMLPKTTGVREHRYTHQLTENIDIEAISTYVKPKSPLEIKIEKLELRIDNLQDNVDELIEVIQNLQNM